MACNLSDACAAGAPAALITEALCAWPHLTLPACQTGSWVTRFPYCAISTQPNSILTSTPSWLAGSTAPNTTGLSRKHIIEGTRGEPIASYTHKHELPFGSCTRQLVLHSRPFKHVSLPSSYATGHQTQLPCCCCCLRFKCVGIVSCCTVAPSRSLPQAAGAGLCGPAVLPPSRPRDAHRGDRARHELGGSMGWVGRWALLHVCLCKRCCAVSLRRAVHCGDHARHELGKCLLPLLSCQTCCSAPAGRTAARLVEKSMQEVYSSRGRPSTDACH